jgi:hypothetical protein
VLLAAARSFVRADGRHARGEWLQEHEANQGGDDKSAKPAFHCAILGRPL